MKSIEFYRDVFLPMKTKNLKFLTHCTMESMLLCPHPPVLLRRAQVADVLPGNYKVNPGQDIMISMYNIHRSAQCCGYILFSGGPRKCVGDQFSFLEAIVALAVLLQVDP